MERDPGSSAEITRLLREWQDGDREALDQVIPLVYEELRLIASRHLAHEWRDPALRTTALVNEAYLKLVDQRHVDWHNRAQFFAVAARVMRRILVDHARRELRDKRGGGEVALGLDEAIAGPNPAVNAVDALALDRALTKLEAIDRDQGRIVELRFFGGLTTEETADALGVSVATVKREWTLAKGWLYRELTGERS